MSNQNDNRAILRALSRMSQLGLTAMFAVAISLAIGYGLDRLFGTDPVLFVIFAVLGVFAAIKAMVDIAGQFKD